MYQSVSTSHHQKSVCLSLSAVQAQPQLTTTSRPTRFTSLQYTYYSPLTNLRAPKTPRTDHRQKPHLDVHRSTAAPHQVTNVQFTNTNAMHSTASLSSITFHAIACSYAIARPVLDIRTPAGSEQYPCSTNTNMSFLAPKPPTATHNQDLNHAPAATLG